MYLKELAVFGFKSFPEKTLLTFEPGITVVVGPNGCGKSNVFDAIKWALGEQSPKSLRGAKMEDIIFNGTEKHPALNYTEVTLTFSNEDKYLPIDFKEVAIGRRLYRSGESNYFINKNPVRLKDVQELFMGTGIGESTYSFVEQGKIEIFLSYKPEDKRLIFDEASGIVKYKERRKETFKKLKEADDNLLRLEDILSEVRRQIRYLERQVAKAKKFKQVQTELIEIEKKTATHSSNRLDESLFKINAELDDLNNKQRAEDELLKEANVSAGQLQDKLKNLHEKVEEASNAIVSLSAQNESASNNIVVYSQRAKELEERNIYLKQSANELTQRLQIQEQRNKEELLRLESIESFVSDIDTKVKSIVDEKNSLQAAVEASKHTITSQKTSILDLEGKRAQLHNTLIEMQTTLVGLINRKKRLLLDTAKLETLLNDNRDSLKAAESDLEQVRMSVEKLQSERETLNSKSKELNTLSENIRNALNEKEKESLELNATYEFLKDLRMKYETFSSTRKVTVIFEEEPKNINKMVASLQDVSFVKENGLFKACIEAKVVSFEEKQLEEKIAIVKTEMTGLKAKISDIIREKEEINEELNAHNSLLDQEKTKMQESLAKKENFQREVSRLEEESELLDTEKSTALEDIEDLQKKQEEIERDKVSLDQQLESSNEQLAQAQGVLENSQERIKEIDLDVAKQNGEIQSLYKEREALSSKISFFQDELNAIRSNLAQIDKETGENESQSISLENQCNDLKNKISENIKRIDEVNKDRISLEGEESVLNKEGNQTRNRISELDKESQAIQSLIYDKRLDVQSLEYEKEKINDYIKQVYDIEFKPVSLVEEERSSDELNIIKEKLQKSVKSLGEVNLVAIEEFEDLKQRNDFLETQKHDLITSKENLKKAIQKINRTSKELFIETFEKIQHEFKKNFRYLFNGGRANLILLDPENVLESGVEIEVQPPGKKLQNVSLLSGGEKSLTAISLIFAIFSVRPSPLCVLDEIDAPLDEANVVRFNSLLREFANASQFVCITHNKNTMSNADVLYGVTMQERGISKLVSVKFASEKEEETAGVSS
jgi:chromosome segregation protein